MNEIASAVEGTVHDLFGDTQEDAPVEEAAAPAEEAAEWDFSADAGGLYDEEEAVVVEEEAPDFSDEDSDDTVGTTDEQNATLRRELAAAKARADYHERHRLRSDRASWEADVRAQPWARFLPEDLSNVQASSHRDFLRQVRQIAKQHYEIMKPSLEALAAERAQLKEHATAEARAEVIAAWGKPTIGGVQVPSGSNAGDDLKKAREGRNLFGAAKALIESGDI